jgi:hypothetical protein
MTYLPDRGRRRIGAQGHTIHSPLYLADAAALIRRFRLDRNLLVAD